MRRVVPLVLLLLCACRHLPPPIEESEGRERALYEQRAYPFGTIPSDGRAIAFREASRTVTATTTQTMVWQALGPQPSLTAWPRWPVQNGRCFPIAVSPADPNVLLVGTGSGGIWRSGDGGKSFRPVTDDQSDLAVGSIAFAPSDPNLVYAGMGNEFLGTGILKSTDAGFHWTRIGGDSAKLRGLIRKVIVDPGDPNHLWLANGGSLQDNGVIGTAGLMVSGDGGLTWTTTFRSRADSLVIDPSNPRTLFATARQVSEPGFVPGVFRSVDGGITWKSVYTGPYSPSASPTIRVEIAPSDPSTLYAHWFGQVGDATQSQFLRSTDGGTTWTPMPAAGLPSERSTYLVADPIDPQTVYLGYRDLYRTNDGGLTWTNLSRGYAGTNGNFSPSISTMHVDQRGLAVSAGGALYATNDGGLFHSTDHGTTFESFAGTLNVIQFYSIAAHPTNPVIVFGGTQDNGLERANSRTKQWEELITGDYGPVVFDANNPARLMTNYVQGSLYRFAGNGDVFDGQAAFNTTFGESNTAPRISFIAPLVERRRDGKVYFGTWRLFASPDFGATWIATAGTKDLTKGASDTLVSIAVSESDPSIIYTGSSQGAVNVSTDAGATFTDVTAGLPNRSVTSLLIDPIVSSTAWVAFSGYRTSHVFRTTTGGASWLDLSTGLPDVPVNDLYLAPDKALYAGTDIGVFRFDGAAWTLFNPGLPPVMVTDFDTTADGRVVISTYGRGAYELVPLAAPVRRRGVAP